MNRSEQLEAVYEVYETGNLDDRPFSNTEEAFEPSVALLNRTITPELERLPESG